MTYKIVSSLITKSDVSIIHGMQRCLCDVIALAFSNIFKLFLLKIYRHTYFIFMTILQMEILSHLFLIYV